MGDVEQQDAADEVRAFTMAALAADLGVLRTSEGRTQGDMTGSASAPVAPPKQSSGVRNRFRISWIRASAAMIYLGWAAWYSWPSWRPSSPPSTFGGLLVAIPGLPWSFGLAKLSKQTDSRLLVTCWLVNASILYWYGGVWERWLRRIAERPR